MKQLLFPPGFIITLLQIHALPHPAVSERQANELVQYGMLKKYPFEDRYRVTRKGKKYIDMLCSVPEPVPMWVDPRDPE